MDNHNPFLFKLIGDVFTCVFWFNAASIHGVKWDASLTLWFAPLKLNYINWLLELHTHTVRKKLYDQGGRGHSNVN